MRRIGAGDTALQLRGEEAASLEPGDPAAHQQLYYALCRGETPGHSCAPARATCSLASHGRPGLLLAPLKLETVCQVLHCTIQYSIVHIVQYSTVRQELGLVIIHDLLSDREVRAMQSNALRRYTATAVNTILQVISPPIISPCLRSPQDAALEARLSRRLELVTGLAVANSHTEFAAEPHQVCHNITHDTLHITHYTLHITHYR